MSSLDYFHMCFLTVRLTPFHLPLHVAWFSAYFVDSPGGSLLGAVALLFGLLLLRLPCCFLPAGFPLPRGRLFALLPLAAHPGAFPFRSICRYFCHYAHFAESALT